MSDWDFEIDTTEFDRVAQDVIDKVEEHEDNRCMSINEMSDIAKEIKAYREEKSQLEKSVKLINAEIEALSIILHRAIEQNGLKNLSIKGVGLVSPITTKNPTIVDQEVFENFLRMNDLSDMMKLTIHPQTLKAWLNNTDIPEVQTPEAIGLSVFEKKSVSIRA
jgi:hypothetical protein